jgi:glycine/D-amino acid oxidase-like deaminating enzyme
MHSPPLLGAQRLTSFTHAHPPCAQVIGGGVIGLAVGARLCQRHPTRSTLLLDRHPRIGMETSSRNSEVIHGMCIAWLPLLGLLLSFG